MTKYEYYKMALRDMMQRDLEAANADNISLTIDDLYMQDLQQRTLDLIADLKHFKREY